MKFMYCMGALESPRGMERRGGGGGGGVVRICMVHTKDDIETRRKAVTKGAKT